MLESLDAISIEAMWWWVSKFYYHFDLIRHLMNIYSFSTQSLRFMDAYQRGLNGKQASWASKKYHGHWVLPKSIMADLAAADMA
jgi:hypothetical protein